MLSIEPVQAHHERAFLAAARRSERLHHPWISPPTTRSAFQRHLVRYAADDQASYVIIEKNEGALVGCAHLNEIVHGALESSYMAYYAFVPFQRRGLMHQGLRLFIDRAFDGHGLHRLEANIQPDNLASRALIRSLGFRLEGFSPRYLKINGEWRDHERYAITVEDWRGEPAR